MFVSLRTFSEGQGGLHTDHASALVKPSRNVRYEQEKRADVHANVYPGNRGFLAPPDVLDLRVERKEAIKDIHRCDDERVFVRSIEYIIDRGEGGGGGGGGRSRNSLNAATRHLYATKLCTRNQWNEQSMHLNVHTHELLNSRMSASESATATEDMESGSQYRAIAVL